MAVDLALMAFIGIFSNVALAVIRMGRRFSLILIVLCRSYNMWMIDMRISSLSVLLIRVAVVNHG